MGCLSLCLELAGIFSIFVQSRCTSAQLCQHYTISVLTYFLMVLHGWRNGSEVLGELFMFLAPDPGKSMLFILQQDQLHL